MDKYLLAWNVHTVSTSVSRIEAPFNIREQIERIESLPLLSSSCRNLMQLMASDSVELEALVDIVENDPMLALQIFRAANSAFYNYRGKLDTVQQAIVRVIGMDKAISMALGLATANSINIAINGAIGMKAFWIQAQASNRLLTCLSKFVDSVEESNIELTLAALLHNIGYPLLGHVYPKIYDQLDKLINVNPQISNLAIEKFALGISHCEIGAWLSKAWDLPESVSCVITNHHDCEYRQKHWRLNLMMYVCDCLLASQAVGVDSMVCIGDDVLEALLIDRASIKQLIQVLPVITETTVSLADQIFGAQMAAA